MWTRSELKGRGKASLHRNYWITVLVTLIYSFLAGSYSNQALKAVWDTGSEDSAQIWEPWVAIAILFGAMLILVWMIIAALLRIFIGNIIEIGSKRFYMENSQKKSPLGLILYGFQSGNYGKNILTLFLRDLYTVLWMLLFVIPGIVKRYEYAMIGYILAENPEISRQRAFEISKQMMHGQKWNAFVLDLSFIGWYVLGAVTFGIVNVLYAVPYCETTWTELYKVNRQMALERGIATKAELPGIVAGM